MILQQKLSPSESSIIVNYPWIDLNSTTRSNIHEIFEIKQQYIYIVKFTPELTRVNRVKIVSNTIYPRRLSKPTIHVSSE